MLSTSAPGRDANRLLEEIAYALKDPQQLGIHGVETAPTAAGEFASVEVIGEFCHTTAHNAGAAGGSHPSCVT